MSVQVLIFFPMFLWFVVYKWLHMNLYSLKQIYPSDKKGLDHFILVILLISFQLVFLFPKSLIFFVISHLVLVLLWRFYIKLILY